MPLKEILSFVIVLAMLGMFIWGRVRYDLVGALTLVIAALCGVVPMNHAFSGFSNSVIITIGAVQVLSRAIAISGVIEAGARWMMRPLPRAWQQIGLLTGGVTALSAFMKNIGALGILVPVAIRSAKNIGRSPSLYLMPLAFGSLIGGTITLIGTSPNLLISAVRQQVVGHRFTMFDFAPVGLPLSILAVIYLMSCFRLIPIRRDSSGPEGPFKLDDYISEARLTSRSRLVGSSIAEFEAAANQEVSVVGIIRDNGLRYIPGSNWQLFADDILVLRADPTTLDSFVKRNNIELIGSEELKRDPAQSGEVVAVEAVITGESPLVGSSAEIIRLRQHYQLNLLSLRRGGTEISQSLAKESLCAGDVLVLQGWESGMARNLADLSLLPLADRELALGQSKPRFLAIGILVAATVAITAGAVPVEVGFFAAAALCVLFRLVSAKEAYNAIDWPIIIMLACLIPVGESLQHTGGSATIAHALTGIAGQVPPVVALGLIMVVSMLVTPLMHHAAAVIVLGPVAADIAHNLHLPVDPFLMAVALGCSSDFLTPIGHQNNLLVMEPGGYGFRDYWRLGLPLSIIILVVGTPLIWWVWSGR
ncbi:MAG TPA: SLC13 family permease [Stellaceae bacterium]|nr:SLC13 family permease [Stellaceae bacterium]